MCFSLAKKRYSSFSLTHSPFLISYTSTQLARSPRSEEVLPFIACNLAAKALLSLFFSFSLSSTKLRVRDFLTTGPYDLSASVVAYPFLFVATIAYSTGLIPCIQTQRATSKWNELVWPLFSPASSAKLYYKPVIHNYQHIYI